MVLKPAYAAVACALWLAGGSAWAAEDYRPGEYLNLDLSKAVLSPKRLGPAAEFVPLPIEARTDTRRVVTERIAMPAKTKLAQPHVEKPHVEKPHVEKPRAAARTRLAHRRASPLDANAMDTRIQTWPCRSGGICNWKR